MRILIAEDEPVSRRVLERVLVKGGHEVLVTGDGAQAWSALQGDDPPPLAVLDWMMPRMDGLEVVQRVRELPLASSTYLILLTARGDRADIVKGLEAGADDYVTKPFDPEELRARVQVGVRMAELQRALADRVRELETALTRVKRLQGLLPICSYCKKIRNDQNYWQKVEAYVSEHSDAEFSHGICPTCYTRFVQPQLEKLRPETEIIS